MPFPSVILRVIIFKIQENARISKIQLQSTSIIIYLYFSYEYSYSVQIREPDKTFGQAIFYESTRANQSRRESKSFGRVKASASSQWKRKTRWYNYFTMSTSDRRRPLAGGQKALLGLTVYFAATWNSPRPADGRLQSTNNTFTFISLGASHHSSNFIRWRNVLPSNPCEFLRAVQEQTILVRRASLGKIWAKLELERFRKKVRRISWARKRPTHQLSAHFRRNDRVRSKPEAWWCLGILYHVS